MMVMNQLGDLPDKHGEFMPLGPFHPQSPPIPRRQRKHLGGFDLSPGDEYLLLVKPKNGSGIRIRCSQNVKPHRDYMSRLFTERLSLNMADEQIANHDESGSQSRGAMVQNPAPVEDSASSNISFVFARESKRQRISSEGLLDMGSTTDIDRMSNEDVSASNSRPLVNLKLGDKEATERWYQDAFQAIQQVACRWLAKTWIKRIQPKKQSTNPYNGACPKDKERPKDPNRTRPPYWPPSVQHKEPDHINREDRITLLVHLIRHTPQAEISNPRRLGQEPELYAKDLKEAIEERKNTIPQDKWEIIEEIIRVRTKEESFERGEIDGNHYIPVPDLSFESRRVQGQPEAQLEAQTAEADVDDQPIPPEYEQYGQHEVVPDVNLEDRLHQDSLDGHLNGAASHDQLRINTSHPEYGMVDPRSTINKIEEDSHGGFTSYEDPEYGGMQSQQITPTSDASQGQFDPNWFEAQSRNPSSTIPVTNMIQNHIGQRHFAPSYPIRMNHNASQEMYSPIFPQDQQTRTMSVSFPHPVVRHQPMPHLSREDLDYHFGHPQQLIMDLPTGYLGREHNLPTRSVSVRPELANADMRQYDFNY